MDQQKQSIADRLKQSNNILVTVSNNPSVDQLASCIGLTLALNKMGKHATAVFSGNVPNTIEFLQPEKTIEKNTDSLRDFIIALDKAKADKLRYKVEDKVVKIFITPYKTSISERDLEFSQGDFNVDVVVALGVHQQTDLDQAITAHGRILHDATVTTINTKPGGELGTINWLDNQASSLSELVVELLDIVDKDLMDGQMATAFLTGIVAETNRFSNEKTTPTTMSISAELMVAGANQQLVATKLEEPTPIPAKAPEEHHDEKQPAQLAAKPKQDDGTLEIEHPELPEAAAEPKSEEHHDEVPQPKPEEHAPEPQPQPISEPEHQEPLAPQIHIDEQGGLHNIEQLPQVQPIHGSIDPNEHLSSSHTLLQPPTEPLMSGATVPDDMSSADPLSGGQGEEAPELASGAPSFMSPASANTAVPAMPFMPPSMTPGGSVTSSAPLPAPEPAMPAPMPPAAIPSPPPVVSPAPSMPFGVPSAPAPVPAPMTATPPAMPAAQPPIPPLPAAPAPSASSLPPQETLSQIEAEVHSPHLQTPAPVFAPAPIEPPAPAAPASGMPPFEPTPSEPPAPAAPAAPIPAPASDDTTANPDLESARNAVMQAIAAQPQPEKSASLNALPLGDSLHADSPAPASPATPSVPPTPAVNFDATANPTFTLPDVDDGTPDNGPAPPPMPPPMMPPVQ